MCYLIADLLHWFYICNTYVQIGRVKKLNTGDLKFLESFNNPYVKVVVLCKECGKEQSLKHENTWKRHYLTHVDEKPFKCSLCPKSFIRASQLRTHEARQHTIDHPCKQEKSTDLNCFSNKIGSKTELFY